MKHSVVKVLAVALFLMTGILTACPATESLPPTSSSQGQDTSISATTFSTSAVTSTIAPDFTAIPSKTRVVPIPAVGADFVIPREYEDWAVVQFSYEVIHQKGSDYHFPWSLTIRNYTDRDLSLMAYIVHWGFHGWVGWVSSTPFLLKARETKTISGEDTLGETFYEEMLYLTNVQIESYIAEVAS
jgi:hypothetical protein